MHPTADPQAPDVDRAQPAPAASPGDGVDPCWPGAVPDVPDAPLIGREADVATVRRLALGRDRTFITLAGIGGVGKSRLAVELTRRALPRRDGRVAFVSLDGVNDPSLVLPAIAGAMGWLPRPRTESPASHSTTCAPPRSTPSAIPPTLLRQMS